MPDPGVSLIPRGSKSTKKRRTSFRPSSKKSSQNKSKAAAAAAAAKAPKTAVSKSDKGESTVTKDVAASKLPTETDSIPKAIEKTTKGNDGGASQPASSAAKSSTTQPHPEGESAQKEKATRTGKSPAPIKLKDSPSPRASAAATAMTTKSPTRKRKAYSLNKRISIGSSLRRKIEATKGVSGSASSAIGNSDRAKDHNMDSSESPESTATLALVQASNKGKDDGEGKENVSGSTTTAKSQELKMLFTPKSEFLSPTFSEHDQAILHQLATEENQEGGSKSLTSFCTPFKVKGRSKRLGKKNASSSSKGESGVKHEDSSMSASSNASKTKKEVDAATTGAPSVQIVDGQIVLQESSVILPSRRTIKEVEEELKDNVVEEDEQLNIVQASYRSFVSKGDVGKTRKMGLWTVDETEKFYCALQQLGTDFGSMEALFFENQRTRKQLKNKYRRELAKRPNLVQELALNPKYQVELDMAALKIEVDPKRIEAHENEEPPAYEPTDVDEITKTESSPLENDDTKVEEGTITEIKDAFDEEEVLEEDAEEERKAEARAKEGGDSKVATKTKAKKRTKTKSTATKAESVQSPRTATKKLTDSSSFWSTTEDDQAESEFGKGVDSGMERDDGPSMDDFFGDSYGDDDPMDEGDTTTESAAKASAAPAARKNEDTPVLPPSQSDQGEKAAAPQKKEARVSLVPKKKTAKPRRPKIRPSSRRKK